jgi:hypothetical protein
MLLLARFLRDAWFALAVMRESIVLVSHKAALDAVCEIRVHL